MDFKEFLKQARQDKNLSQRRLAELADVSHSHLAQIESGQRGTPSPDVLRKIAVPLGVPYLELMLRAGHITWKELSIQIDFNGDIREEEIHRLSSLLEPNGNAKDGEPFITNELKHLLKYSEFVFYNGHSLTNEDKQRILTMLEMLFPQYGEDQ